MRPRDQPVYAGCSDRGRVRAVRARILPGAGRRRRVRRVRAWDVQHRCRRADEIRLPGVPGRPLVRAVCGASTGAAREEAARARRTAGGWLAQCAPRARRSPTLTAARSAPPACGPRPSARRRRMSAVRCAGLRSTRLNAIERVCAQRHARRERTLCPGPRTARTAPRGLGPLLHPRLPWPRVPRVPLAALGQRRVRRRLRRVHRCAERRMVTLRRQPVCAVRGGDVRWCRGAVTMPTVRAVPRLVVELAARVLQCAGRCTAGRFSAAVGARSPLTCVAIAMLRWTGTSIIRALPNPQVSVVPRRHAWIQDRRHDSRAGVSGVRSRAVQRARRCVRAARRL